MVGRFDNDTATLTVRNLPDHRALRLTFDLYVIGPWGGGGNAGYFGDADRWTATLRSGEVLLDTTFRNLAVGEFNEGQTYPNSFGGTRRNPRSGADQNNNLGYPLGSSAGSSTYNLDFAIRHRGDEIVIDFQGLSLEAGETWGIDNVRLVTDDSAHFVNLDYEEVAANRNFGNDFGTPLPPAPVQVSAEDVRELALLQSCKGV
jgi:hypothetical protein